MKVRLQIPILTRAVTLNSRRTATEHLAHPVEPARPQHRGAQVSAMLEFAHFVRRNYKRLGAAGIVGVGLAVLVTGSQAPLYRAAATLEIQDLNENFLNLKDISPINLSMPGMGASDLQTQLRILRSNSLLERVVARMTPERQPPPAGIRALVRRMRGANGQERPITHEDMVDTAGRNLQVQETRQARIVDLIYSGPDPQYAAAFVNKLAGEFINQSIEARRQLSRNTSAWLGSQLDEQRKKLASSEDRLQSYARRSGLLVTDDKQNPVEEKLRQVQESLSKAQENRVIRQARMETAAAAPPESLEPSAANSIREYQTKLTDLQRQRADMVTVFKPDFDGVKRLDAQIATLELAVRSERVSVLQSIRNDYADATRREDLLRGSYLRQIGRVSQHAEKAIQYGMLKHEVDTNRQIYENMLQRMAEANVASAMRAGNARVVDLAKAPRRPYRPSLYLNVLWGLTAGVLAGVLIGTAHERSDRRIKNPGDLAYYLGVSELGVVPAAVRLNSARQRRHAAAGGILLNAGASAECVTSVELAAWHRRSSSIAESFRGILTSVLFSDEDRPTPQVIVITSAGPAEGKTTFATNIAASLARMNRSVLLVDCHLQRPRLHQIFEVSNDYGLCDLLTVDANNLDLIPYVTQKTGIPGVSVVAAGPRDPRAVDLIYSASMYDLLNHARREFDTVLIDTPPMLDAPDARVLGRMADGVILVVRSRGVTRDTVMSVQARLREDGTALLGAVLNSWAH